MFLRARPLAELMKLPIQPEELVNVVDREHYIPVSYDLATLLICLTAVLLPRPRLVARSYTLAIPIAALS